IKRQCDAMHELRYGTCAPEERAEVVSLRTTVTGAMRKPPLKPIPGGGPAPAPDAFTGDRLVYFAERGGFLPTPTYAREGLRAGNRLSGPALVEEHASTTVLPPGNTLALDALGALVIDVAGGRWAAWRARPTPSSPSSCATAWWRSPKR